MRGEDNQKMKTTLLSIFFGNLSNKVINAFSSFLSIMFFFINALQLFRFGKDSFYFYKNKRPFQCLTKMAAK